MRNVRYSFEVETEVNPQELMVLSELSSHGPMRVKDIAVRLVGVSPSTLTRILDRLEQEGLVQRSLKPDGHAQLPGATLTERGRTVADDYTSHLEDVVRRYAGPPHPGGAHDARRTAVHDGHRVGFLSGETRLKSKPPPFSPTTSH